MKVLILIVKRVYYAFFIGLMLFDQQNIFIDNNYIV